MTRPDPDDLALRDAIRQSGAFDGPDDVQPFSDRVMAQWRDTVVASGPAARRHHPARWAAAAALGMCAVFAVVDTLLPHDAASPASVGRVDVLSEMSIGGL